MNRTTGVVIATGILLLLISFYIFFSLSQNSPASNSVANTPTPLLEQSSAPLTDTPSVQEPVKAFRQGTWHQFKTLLFLAPENWRVVTSTGTDVVWMQPASQSDLSSFPRIQISFSRPLEDLEYVSVSERYSGYEDYYAAINANSRIASAYQAEYPNFVTTEPVIIQNRAVIVQEAGNEYTIFYQYQAEELQPEAEKIFIELLESLRYR